MTTNLLDVIGEVRRYLEQNGRVSLRMLKRQYELDDESLEELIEELVDIQRVATREDNLLAWVQAAHAAGPDPAERSHTPEHRADKTHQSKSGLQGERKVVTVVFADLAGSTALHERLDAESVRAFMQRYYDAMQSAVAAHGGTVAKLLGDGVLAVFGTPRVAEDDAPRAVHAAFEMHRAFRELAEQHTALVGAIGLRVAVNTGEVVVSDDAEIVGDPVNVASRLQEQCADGDVVVGEATHRLVSQLVTLKPLGAFALKGRAEAVTAFRVESLERPSGASAAFVGRDDELARINSVYEGAIDTPATALTVLMGSPGLGKSRLIDEFTERLGDTASIVSAHCSDTSAATFAPLVLALREHLAIDAAASGDGLRAAIEAAIPGEDGDRSRIAAGIAALFSGSPTSPEETFFVVRRLFAALAAVRPIVLVIDDLQWAEPMLLDLVEHLVEWGGKVPMLVLVGARPELRDKRSSLTTPGGQVADVVTLGGLDAGAAMRLAANVIGASDLPAVVAAKVLASSEGNPLFVGELVRMLVHEGALKREGDRWTTGTALAALEMPPTIQALLAARIERLHPEERVVLERASVVGRNFSRSAVAELLPDDVTDLDARLESLGRSELIERDTGWFLGEPVLRFHHVLIRDAAYRQLLKGTRAELHSRFADWVLARAGDSVEHDEMVGWHLEQAHRLLGELGPIDANGRAIGERASKYLGAAGRRALAGDDVSLAASLLGRATDRLDPDNPARSELALDWCEALLAAGDVGTATSAIAELDRLANAAETADSERLRAWHTCFAGQHKVLTAPEGLQPTADSVAAAAEALASQGDAAGEAKAHFVYALALARLGKIGACEAALDRALAAARRVTGDRRRANTVLAVAPLAALWGPSPVTRASGRCLDVVRVLRITQGAPAVEAVALSCQGVLEALRGRTDAARRMIASSREMVEELGITQRLLEVEVSSGLVDLLEGDAVAAEGHLRSAYEGMRELGLGIDAARAAALLARALLASDQVAEAETLSHESEVLAGDDLKAAIAWRGVRAEALARRGEHAAAVEFASAAVEIAAATDALLDHADARLALAAALRAAGRSREADDEERRAYDLWEAKGATLLAERAQGDAANIAPVEAAADEPTAAQAVRRRVRPNAATAMQTRIDVAVAARDFDAIRAQMSDSHVEIDHPTGSTYGADECLASMQRLLRSKDPHYEILPLATFGESLMLARRRSGASSATSKHFDVGEYENHAMVIFEVDERELMCRGEVFADARLNDAMAFLYERYAELLPEGLQRERANMTARSMVAMLVTPNDLDLMATVLAPDFESVDHRHLSTWSMRGADAYVEHMSALQAVADDIEMRTDDILALENNALLIRRMHSGTERVGGGVYERAFLALFATDSDGRFARAEWFDEDRTTEAFARFDELAAGSEQPRAVDRRVPSNRATAFCERFGAATSARDAETIDADLSENFDYMHHPTATGYGKRGFMKQWRSMLEAEGMERSHEMLGALGESLALGREWVSVSGLKEKALEAFGPVEIHDVFITEDDGQGMCRRIEMFATEHLGDAVARLYERHAELLAEGPKRDRAVATAQGIAAMLGAADPEAAAAFAAPMIEFSDHRTLGFSPSRGVDAFHEWGRAMFEVEDFALGVDDILRIQPGGTLLATTTSGTARSSGGAYERSLLSLWIYADDGLLTHMELFDTGDEAEALARFDELTAPPAQPRSVSRRVPPNLATAISDRLGAALDAQDADAVAADLSESFEYRHHSTGTSFDSSGYVAQWQAAFAAERFDRVFEILGTLGERLSIGRESTSLAGLKGKDVELFGPTELHDFYVVESDAEGLCQRVEIFAAERLSNAFVHMYERYAELAPEDEKRHRAATTARAIAWMRGPIDPEMVASVVAPTAELIDHRILGFGSIRGLDAMREYIRAFHELEDSTIELDDILALHPRIALVHTTTMGTARTGGGAYERPMLQIWGFGADGRFVRIEHFDDGCEVEALARFDELVGVESAPHSDPFANAAVRASERNMAAWMDGDWEQFERGFAADFHLSERRSEVQLELDRDDALSFLRAYGEQATTRVIESSTIATRGERLVLRRNRVEIADDTVGPSEIVHLNLFEANEDGAVVAITRWNEEDLDAAYAELDARYDVGEADAYRQSWQAIQNFVRAVADRDWDGVTALCTDKFIEYDHRSLAVLGTTHGAEAWVRNFSTLVALAPDTIYRVHHFLPEARAYYVRGGWYGKQKGGDYEMPLNAVLELDECGLMIRADIYDDEGDAAFARLADLAEPGASPSPAANTATHARARNFAAGMDKSQERFAGAGSGATADPLAAIAKPNAAVKAMDRWAISYDTGMDTDDWETMRSLCASDCVFDDRRRMALLDGDLDLMLASARERAAIGARPQRQLLGTAGDRVAIERMLWSGGPPDGRFEIEYLAVVEIDESGLFSTFVLMDLDDPRAAQREAWARWAATEPWAAAVVTPLGEANDAFNAQDRVTWRAAFADDLVVEDHRLAGIGRIDGADAYTQSIVALWDLAPVTQVGVGWLWPAIDHCGGLTGARRTGTIPDGGDFVSEYLYLYLVAEGRITHLELFELGALDVALARFEELRPDPLRIPPNAATRLLQKLRATEDDDAVRALATEDFVFDDRKKLALVVGGVEEWVGSLEFLRSEAGARIDSRLVATAGDRLALHRTRWHEAAGDARLEMDGYRITEVDEAGKLRALVVFDPDDRVAADTELFERYVAIGADGMPSGVVEFLHGWNQHDLVRARRALTDDFVLDDHRRTGMGRLEGPDAYIESVAALHELIPDAHLEFLYSAAIAKHGRVNVARTSGANTEGGAVESLLVAIILYRGEKLCSLEFFELEYLDDALARLEELRPESADTQEVV